MSHAFHPPIRVLLVEDNPGDARLIGEMLAATGTTRWDLAHADSLAEAAALLAQTPADAILLDLSLPDGRGLETLARVLNFAPETPVVVLTGLGDDPTAMRAVQEGAQDYLVKGEFGGRTLVRSVYYAIERSRAERVERERRGLESALRAMDHLLGVLGHELRTPLTSLRLLSEYLLTDQDTTAGKWDEFLRSINGEVLRMTDLVNNLLEAARLDSGVSQWNWSIVDAAAVCDDALHLLRPLIGGRDVLLAADVAPEHLTFRGDPDALRRLVLNLVNNAIKHTAAGRIDVVVRAAQRAGKPWISLSVRDTGAGITEDVARRLGTAFALNSGVAAGRGGTGLGLAICKGIAAAHGGTLSVASAPGKGTTFNALLRGDLPGPEPVPENLKIIREAAA